VDQIATARNLANIINVEVVAEVQVFA